MRMISILNSLVFTGAKRGPFTWRSNPTCGKEMTIHVKVLFKLIGDWSIWDEVFFFDAVPAA